MAKDIRLRNELISTPEKSRRAQAAQPAAPVSGLVVVQFEAPLSDPQRSQLKELGVTLLNPVPEDAFVARFKGVPLSTVRDLPFVRWVGDYEPKHKLHRAVANVKEKETHAVSILATADAPLQELVRLHRLTGGLQVEAKIPAGKILRANVNAKQIDALSLSSAILWIEPAPNHKLFDEIASEIVGGEFEGFGTFVNELGFDGDGVSVAVADSGLHAGAAVDMHPDLFGRVDAFFYYGNLQDASDEHSHGTHVAGIVAGNGAVGEVDEFGYLYGVGVAPKAHIVAQRLFDGAGGYEPPSSFAAMTADAVRAGADIGSNSWGDDTNGRYDLSAAQFDALVRDADENTPGDQPYILEFSAGNAGPGESTIGSPAVAKNVIATGASENNRFDFIIYAEGQENMADFSSRGPAEDGRIKPDLVAPGTWIASLQSSAATDEYAWLGISTYYQYQGGTSQAGPHVSGGAAVFVQYYRETHDGQTPSPALVKGALINSAVDMDASWGTASVPNNDEGWGRMDLTELIAADRSYEFVDQTSPLTQGAVYEKRIIVTDASMPLKFTLTYTDFPGAPFTIPALVNDLDLEVISPEGILFAGNQFINGESVPAAATRDNINNVEGVHLNFPSAGEYTIRVRATRVAQDVRRDTAATDQDFALVISGGLPDPTRPVILFDRRAYTAPATIGLRLVNFDLAGQPAATVTIASTTETTPITVTLQAAGTVGVFTGSIATAQGPAINDAILQINHGDTITATYQTATATVPADLAPPVISNVSAANRFGRELISFDVNERASGTVRYGASPQDLSMTASNPSFRTSHQIIAGNLVPNQTYYYSVTATDEAGNVTINNNNGAFFTFVAQPPATLLLVDDYVHFQDDPLVPVTAYTDALDQTGVSYDVWNVQSEGQPQLASLSPYRIVIWRLNDSFNAYFNGDRASTTLSPSEQSILTSYLDGGGSLFLSSMEVLSRIGDVPFRTNVLQVAEFVLNSNEFGEPCASCDEDHTVPVVEGEDSDSIGAGVHVTIDYSQYPFFDFGGVFPDIGPDLGDTFTPTTNAVPIFRDAMSGRVVGIRAPAALDASSRVVFLSFPIDGVPMQGDAPNTRPHILRNVLSFLAPGINGFGSLNLNRPAYTTPDQVTIQVADSDLAGQLRTTVRLRTETEPAGVQIELLETPRPGVFAASVTLAAPGEDGAIHAVDGNELIAEYLDASGNFTVTARAYIDTVDPAISAVSVEPDFEVAVVSWNTDEPADSLVQFGESAFLGRTAYRSALTWTRELTLDGLVPNRRYYYQVVSRDEAGNFKIDDNNGALYTFTTRAPQPLPFTDNFETDSGEWTVESGEDAEFSWERGTPANGSQNAGHSGANAWGTNLRNRPGTYTETALISPAFDLTDATRATLQFWHSYDFTVPATWETAQLYVVTNVQTAAVLIASFEDGELAAAWELEEIDLTPYVGHVVRLVWFYQLLDVEEFGEPHPGWLIDDVTVTANTSPVGELRVTSNLSQAAYSISGPTPAIGAGLAYSNRAALPGTYTVTFGDVQYYTTPAPQTGTLDANGVLTLNGVFTINDANQNGIADEWETAWFGGPINAGADADGDRLNNYCEWIAGTNPLDNKANLAFTRMAVVPGNNLELTWATVVGRSYRVLISSDASNWTPATEWFRAAATDATHSLSLSAGAAAFVKIEVRP